LHNAKQFIPGRVSRSGIFFARTAALAFVPTLPRGNATFAGIPPVHGEGRCEPKRAIQPVPCGDPWIASEPAALCLGKRITP